MSLDPLGYYTRLGVAPDAAPDEVKAAFLRQARRLHPDVPGTGDPAAFVRLKEAYDVVSSPLQRAAYRRAALAGTASPPPARPPRTTPLWMLNPALRSPWLAAIGALVVATVLAIVLLIRTGDPDPRQAVPADPGPIAEAQPQPEPQPPAPPPALAGTPDHYVLPAAGPATVWQGDPAGGPLTSGAALPAFAPVHVPPRPAPGGLLPVELAGGGVGYVDASRLMPGDALAARHANCAYLAGRPPVDGEVLAGGDSGGAARANLANASSGPAVVTLRDRTGALVARVYLAPHGAARLTGLQSGPWTAEVAFGELWSRACTAFVAGERVARAPAPVPPGGTLTIGPQAPNG